MRLLPCWSGLVRNWSSTVMTTKISARRWLVRVEKRYRSLALGRRRMRAINCAARDTTFLRSKGLRSRGITRAHNRALDAFQEVRREVL